MICINCKKPIPKGINGSSEEKNKEFCAKCGVEFHKYEMVRRKNEKGEIHWLCIYCASKYYS